MFDTIIVSGGNIRKDFALNYLKEMKDRCKGSEMCLIAADHGLDFLLDAGMKPDVAIGDFDSVSEQGKAYLSRGEGTVIRLKPEKDDSDTQSALKHAIQHGAKQICILGATGSRLDHVMANLGLLLLGRQYGVCVTLVDANNHISLAENGKIIRKEEQFGKYVSFFALGGPVKKLSLKGFKYSLMNYDLNMSDSGLTVSNEIQDEYAEIYFEEGSLLMIMSRD